METGVLDDDYYDYGNECLLRMWGRSSKLANRSLQLRCPAIYVRSSKYENPIPLVQASRSRTAHEALERYGPPEIFNNDQGSQFTSVDFTDVLTEAGIRISMDGKGRWMDNVFIERLWRSLKYECVYLSEFATGSQARTGIGGWMDFYDRCRPHSSLNDRTPDEAYTNDGADTRPGLRPVSCQPHVA